MLTREERTKELEEQIEEEIEEEKRVISGRIIKFIFIIILLFISIFLGIRYLGNAFIQTNEYKVENPNIPLNFHGVKILHFSDLLYGSTIDQNSLKKLTTEFNRIKPDIVVYTGDIVDKKYHLKDADIEILNAFFKEIPYTIGKYLVIGDYDYIKGFDEIIDNTGFINLKNEYTLAYYKANEPIAILGFSFNNKDIDTEEIKDYYKIALIHNFDNYNQSIKSDLILAGHNLNGEIYLGKGLLGENKYNGRYYYIDNTSVYISNGLGSIHKLRLFNHPSINVYRLLKY